MEGDTKIVINSVRKGGIFHSIFSHLFKGTVSYVNSLQNFYFYHTYRQGKRARLYSFLSV